MLALGTMTCQQLTFSHTNIDTHTHALRQCSTQLYALCSRNTDIYKTRIASNRRATFLSKPRTVYKAPFGPICSLTLFPLALLPSLPPSPLQPALSFLLIADLFQPNLFPLVSLSHHNLSSSAFIQDLSNLLNYFSPKKMQSNLRSLQAVPSHDPDMQIRRPV